MGVAFSVGRRLNRRGSRVMLRLATIFEREADHYRREGRDAAIDQMDVKLVAQLRALDRGENVDNFTLRSLDGEQIDAVRLFIKSYRSMHFDEGDI